MDRLVLVSPSISGYVPEEMPDFLTDLMSALREQEFDRANEILLASSLMSVPPQEQARVREMVLSNDRLWQIPYSLVQQPEKVAFEHLEEITFPTLIVVGKNDAPAIQGQATVMKQRMPNARIVSITDGEHLLNLTSPETFKDTLRDFLVNAEN